jgi:tetratricopeptide (TPR) repeat protein
MTSALRALDVNAMVAEAVSFPGDRSPPDPSGQLGYFVVAVYAGDAGQGDPTYFDPYSGRTTAPEEARVLTDLQAIGAAIGTRALHLLSRESDPERAIESATQALRLDQRSPSLRAVRGAILLASGQVDQGVRELESAKQLRLDAPRRNLVAAIYLAPSPFQDLEAASREVSAALEEYPEFAPGRATLAAIHLSQQETDLARSELAEAERLDPQYHLLPQLWASYYVMSGDTDRAIEYARSAIAQNPADVQAHLLAARIYRQSARFDLMRREAHEVIERTAPSRRAEMTQVIQQLLGPTALEPIEDEEEITDEELLADEELVVGDAAPGSMRLDSPLLGGEGGGPSLGGGGGGGPSLLGDDQRLGGGAPSGGGFQLGGGGGGNLRLNLGGGQ